MSDDGFNPYHEWLGLDRSMTQPNHYQLLGLDPSEQSAQRIAQAADRATARVRSCRPGHRGSQWAKLLDEIAAAASCLTDPSRRAEYNRQSGRGGTARSYSRPAPRSRVTPTAGGPSASNAMPGPASAALPMQAPQGLSAANAVHPRGPAAYLDPMAPVVPLGPTGSVPACGPASAYGGSVMPPTSSLPSYPAARGYPVRGVPTPIPATPAPGKDRSVSTKVRQRSQTSTLTVVAASAGVGMVLLAGAIVLIVLAKKSEDRGRDTYGTSLPTRPITHFPSPPPETFHRPTPARRPPRSAERKLRRPVPRSEALESTPDAALSAAIGSSPAVAGTDSPPPTGPGGAEVLAEPTFSAPGGNSPAVPPPAVMPAAQPSPDSSLSLPAFPAGPTLPSPDTQPPAQPNPLAPDAPPAVPPQPTEAKPDETMPKSSPSEFKPALSDTKPEPPKPAEPASVDAAVRTEEIAALAKSLQAAHAAIQNGRYEAAEAELNKVESLPKLPEHHAKFERLTLLAGYAKSFQSALKSAVAGLQPGDEIEVGSSTVVGFVSAAKDSITLRVTGTNRTYALDSLPAGLAVAIADRWLKKDDPVSLATKGAYLASLKESDDDRRAKARQWLEEASKRGVEGELQKVLDDTYDLEKDEK